MTSQSPKLISIKNAAKKLDINLEFLLAYIDSINSFSSSEHKQINLYADYKDTYLPGRFKSIAKATRNAKETSPFVFKGKNIRPQDISILDTKISQDQLKAIMAGPKEFRRVPSKLTAIMSDPQKAKSLKEKVNAHKLSKGIAIRYSSKTRTIKKGSKSIQLTSKQAVVFEVLYEEYTNAFQDNRKVKPMTEKSILSKNDSSKSDRIRDIFRSREKDGIKDIIKKNANQKYYLE